MSLRITLLLLLYLISLSAKAVVPFVVEPEQPHTVLDQNYLEILQQLSANTEFADIKVGQFSNRFQPVETANLRQQYIKGEVWLRWNMRNELRRAQLLVLDFGVLLIHQVDLYYPDAQGHYQHIQKGRGVPRAEQVMRHRWLSLPVSVMPGEHTYYLRIKNNSRQTIQLSVQSYTQYISRSEDINLWMGIYYGLIITLVSVTLILYVLDRKPLNLMLLGTFLFSGLIYTYSDGIMFQWLEGSMPAETNIGMYGILLKALCLILFIYCYYPASIYQPWHKVAYRLCWFGGGIIFVLMSIFNFMLMAYIAFAYIQIFPLVIACVLISLRQKVPMNYLLFAALLLYFSDYFLNLIYHTVAIQGVGDYFLYSRFVGVSALICLVLALVKHYNQNRLEQVLALERAKDAEKDMQVKDQFFAAMSHEIRTPMNGVIGMVDLLKKTDLSSQQQYYLNIVAESGNSLLQIINEILDFSKITSGNMKVENIPFRLNKIVMDCVLLLTANTRAKNISIRYSISDVISPVILGDPMRIRQVLLNLLGNAIKFTDKGEVYLSVILDKTGGDNKLCFIIEDSGVGISDDEIDTLFMSFQQAKKSTTRQYGGTGLGLTISKQLVELMGGGITVVSELAKGSTFTVSLPYKPAETNDAAIEEQPEQFADLPCLNILLVEDNPTNQKVAIAMLKNLGMHVESVENGQEALDKLTRNNHPYDVVFMDCDMPVLDGYEATRQLRQYEMANGTHTHIIALSAHALKEYQERALSAGMDDYLSKPLKQNDLHMVLIKFLNSKSE